MRFGAFGTPRDGKSFTTAVRAFALAGRLGDRLLLNVYGPRRPRLLKWATALGLDRTVDFVEGAGDIGDGAIDVLILLSIPDPRWPATWASKCREDARFILV